LGATLPLRCVPAFRQKAEPSAERPTASDSD
jgi:hypothetical protein